MKTWYIEYVDIDNCRYCGYVEAEARAEAITKIYTVQYVDRVVRCEVAWEDE